MDIKKLNEMRVKGWDTYSAEELVEAAAFAAALKSNFTDTETSIKDVMFGKMSVGDTLKVSLGDYNYSASKTVRPGFDIDIPEAEFIELLDESGLGSVFVKRSLDRRALRDAHKKETLAPLLVDHIVDSDVESVSFRRTKGGEK